MRKQQIFWTVLETCHNQAKTLNRVHMTRSFDEVLINPKNLISCCIYKYMLQRRQAMK